LISAASSSLFYSKIAIFSAANLSFFSNSSLIFNMTSDSFALAWAIYASFKILFSSQAFLIYSF
jgi:hypothetical protein